MAIDYVSGTGPGFAALDLDPASAAWVMAHKDAVRARRAAVRYLDDPPHLTLCVGDYLEHSRVINALHVVAERTASVVADTADWLVFRDDPLTGGHTLACAFSPMAAATQRVVQASVLAAISPLRDPARSAARYAAHMAQLSPLRQASVVRYGFPFTGEDWIPHVSIASIAPAAWDEVWTEMQRRPPPAQFVFSGLVWYALDGERPVRHAVFPFAS